MTHLWADENMDACGFSHFLNTVVGLGVWNHLPRALYFLKAFFFAGGIKFLDSWALLKNDCLCLADFWCLDWKNQSKPIPLCRLMLWWCDFKDTRKALTDVSLSLKFIISPWRIPSFIKNQSISQTSFWNANPGIRIKKQNSVWIS